jgi:hypothetical protein
VWKEKFGQAKFDADVVSEPSYPVEVMKDVGSDCKILSERNLELEMASQEVIFSQRQESKASWPAAQLSAVPSPRTCRLLQSAHHPMTSLCPEPQKRAASVRSVEKL